MTERVCRNCKYHGKAPWYGEGDCRNPESTYYECYTFDDAHCKAWDEKEENDDADS